jgi:hypothetical protein
MHDARARQEKGRKYSLPRTGKLNGEAIRLSVLQWRIRSL